MIPIKGFEDYLINELGEIFSTKRKVIKQRAWSLKGNGYFQIDLWKDNKCTYKSIHRLLAQMYLPNYSEELQVNHIDGNPRNNSLNNLEMVTHSENTIHAIRLGLRKTQKGSDAYNAKLTQKDINEIRQNPLNLTQRQLSAKYGVCNQQISRIINNLRWVDSK